jgi:hypothetical protein
LKEPQFTKESGFVGKEVAEASRLVLEVVGGSRNEKTRYTKAYRVIRGGIDEQSADKKECRRMS